jgi:thioredoxin 1
MHRRLLFLTAILAMAALAVPAHAATQAAYTQQAFDSAQAAGKPILVAVHASWCPVCSKQKPIIAHLIQAPEFKDLLILTVDYDSQKDIVKAFGVTKQSTLIAFRGRAERDRSVGVTDQEAIQVLMLKAAA